LKVVWLLHGGGEDKDNSVLFGAAALALHSLLHAPAAAVALPRQRPYMATYVI
jgi:hypothetical protein